MRGSGAALLATACIAVLTACGGTSAPVASPQIDREWAANTSGVIDELERDVLLAGSGGTTIAAARNALRSQSDLYTILVAYTDFGGCSHMVEAAGVSTALFAAVEHTLASACGLLQRGAALFTKAATAHDARALLAATRLVLAASPLLLRAKTELDRALGA